MRSNSESNKVGIWVRAARPQTLPAAIIPVMVGAGLAVRSELFSWPATLVALTCALLIQIGTNFANDYYDFIKGADTPHRVGFQRATSSGLINAHQMLTATIITMSLAFVLGLYLVWLAGWPILIVGVASLVCGVAYTGGPFPLGYHGLGDLFVFIFFGIVAVVGTYYVNALKWNWTTFVSSLPIGALSTNILVVNNLRDIDQDRKAGKKTLGVLFGARSLQVEYTVMGLLSIFIPVYLYITHPFTIWILLPLLSLPAGIYLTFYIWTETDLSKFNQLLEQTGQWMTLYGILFTIGIITG